MLIGQDKERERSIPISLIRQHAYCPRIPFFSEVMNLHPPTPLWVDQGQAFHDREAELMRRRVIAKFGMTNAKLMSRCELRNREHNVHGVADLVLMNENQISIVEFKLTEHSIHRGAIWQIYFYMRSAAEMFGRKVCKGFLVFGQRGRTKEIKITDAIERDALNALRELRQMLDRAVMPDSSAGPRQCGQCEYIQRCNDRD